MEWELLTEVLLSNAILVVGVMLGCIVLATVVLLVMRLLEKGGLWSLITALCTLFFVLLVAATWFDYNRKVKYQRWDQDYQEEVGLRNE